MSYLNDLINLLPLNMRTFASTATGNKSTITEKDLSKEELAALGEAVERAKRFNSSQEERYRNLRYITPQEYRLNPEQTLIPEKPGSTRLTRQPVPYTDYIADLDRKIKSYDDTRGRTSVGYRDYKTQSGNDPTGVNLSWPQALKESFTDPAFRVATTLGSFKAYDTPNGVNIKDDYGFDADQQWFYRNAADKSLYDIVKDYGTRPGSLGEILFRKYLGDTSRPININLQK